MSFIHYMFHWYDGNVWGNLVAEIVVAIPAWLVGYFKLKKHQTKLHKDMKRHITEQINIDRTSI